MREKSRIGAHMALLRLYETTVQSEGLVGKIVSIPNAVGRENTVVPLSPHEALLAFCDELGAEITHERLRPEMLYRALSNSMVLPGHSHELSELIGALLYAPIAVVEESPPAGSAIASLVTWGGAPSSRLTPQQPPWRFTGPARLSPG